MTWIYWIRHFDTKFQASCLRARLEEDWWLRGYNSPKEIEIFRYKNGKYGVRFQLD